MMLPADMLCLQQRIETWLPAQGCADTSRRSLVYHCRGGWTRLLSCPECCRGHREWWQSCRLPCWLTHGIRDALAVGVGGPQAPLLQHVLHVAAVERKQGLQAAVEGFLLVPALYSSSSRGFEASAGEGVGGALLTSSVSGFESEQQHALPARKLWSVLHKAGLASLHKSAYTTDHALVNILDARHDTAANRQGLQACTSQRTPLIMHWSIFLMPGMTLQQTGMLVPTSLRGSPGGLCCLWIPPERPQHEVGS